MEPVHLLKANGADRAPFADETLCGLHLANDTAAMWPGERLHTRTYWIHGKWCSDCKQREKGIFASCPNTSN